MNTWVYSRNWENNNQIKTHVLVYFADSFTKKLLWYRREFWKISKSKHYIERLLTAASSNNTTDENLLSLTRPVEIEKNLGGGGGKFIKKRWPTGLANYEDRSIKIV